MPSQADQFATELTGPGSITDREMSRLQSITGIFTGKSLRDMYALVGEVPRLVRRKYSPPPVIYPPDFLPAIYNFGRHPSVTAQQPGGRVAYDATFHNGKLYVGYGDWNNNTGPIDVVCLNPATGKWETALEDAPTEAIEIFRIINGSLFIPWVDSHPTMPYLGYSTDRGGTWHNVDNGLSGALHNFDIASYTGNPDTDLYFCGATIDSIDQLGHGVIFHSTDGGATWNIVFDQGSPGNFSRIEKMAKYGAHLYAVGINVYRYDGVSWSTFMPTWDLGNKLTPTQGLLVGTTGWFNGTTVTKYVDPADGVTNMSMACISVDSLDRLWGVWSNNLYIADIVAPSSFAWRRVGHLAWNVYMPSEVVVNPATGIMYVVGADGNVLATNAPAV